MGFIKVYQIEDLSDWGQLASVIVLVALAAIAIAISTGAVGVFSVFLFSNHRVVKKLPYAVRNILSKIKQ